MECEELLQSMLNISSSFGHVVVNPKEHRTELLKKLLLLNQNGGQRLDSDTL